MNISVAYGFMCGLIENWNVVVKANFNYKNKYSVFFKFIYCKGEISESGQRI